MDRIDGQLLSLLTFLPFAAAVVLLAVNWLAGVMGLRGLPVAIWRAVAIGASVLSFGLALRLFVGFDPIDTDFQFVEYARWLPEYGIHHFFGIDGISLLLVLLTTFLMPLVLLASWNDITSQIKSFLFFMLALETGMLGAFVSLNAFEFYVFWEVMLVPMYFLVGIWGGPRRVYAAIKFFLFTMAGSLLMLVGLVVVAMLFYEQRGVLSFDLVAAPGRELAGLLALDVPTTGEAPWWQTQTWLFAAFALAFAVKIPVVPLHTWLPDAHVEAPTAGSVVLAGVLLKMGGYGFLRFAIPLFPAAAIEFAPWMAGAGLVGIVYGSLLALAQSDMKKLVAYSSVAHMGFVVVGFFALNVEGLTGGVLQMINHGISTSALFLLVGFLYERRHTREIADFGGVAKPMPVYAALLVIVAMSSIGLPMLNGFVGEVLILIGAYLASPPVAVVATSGIVLGAAYMLWMVRRVLMGPVEHAENRSLIDLSRRERFVLVALVVPIFWIGIYPDPLLRRIEPSVIELLRRVEAVAPVEVDESTPAPELPAAEDTL